MIFLSNACQIAILQKRSQPYCLGGKEMKKISRLLVMVVMVGSTSLWAAGGDLPPHAVAVAKDTNMRPITVIDEGETVLLDGTESTDPDPQGAILLWDWQQTGGTPGVTVNIIDDDKDLARFIAPDVTVDGVVTVDVTLTVADNAGLEDSATVTVTINQPPVADAGEDDNTVTVGDQVTLDGTGSSDPDGTIGSYFWEQIPGPSVTLTGADTSQPTFTAPEVAVPTSLTFRLSVTDNQGTQNLATDLNYEVIITVNPLTPTRYVDESNQPGPVRGTAGDPYTSIWLGMDEANIANNDPDIDDIERIEVMGCGTYVEDVVLVDDIVLASQVRRGPTIQGSVTMADRSILEGFRISHSSIAEAGVILDSVSNVEVCHNTITSTADAPGTTLSSLEIHILNAETTTNIYIHNNVISTNATGSNCKAKGLAITQDPGDTTTVQYDQVQIINNTIDITSDKYAYGLHMDVDNYYDGFTYASGIVIKNNIISLLYKTTRPPNYCAWKSSSSRVPIRYSNLYLKGGNSGDNEANMYVIASFPDNQRKQDPIYLDGDFLLSEDSPCVDAGTPDEDGDPTNNEGQIWDYSNEPQPNGGRINMGAYGNTPEAAIRGIARGDIIGDITGDGIVDIDDFLLLVGDWLESGSIADIAPAPCGDDIVNFRDFGIIAENWLR